MIHKLVRVRAYGNQEINGLLAQAHLTVGPVIPPIQPVVISSTPECVVGRDLLDPWQNPYIGSLTCVEGTFNTAKTK